MTTVRTRLGVVVLSVVAAITLLAGVGASSAGAQTTSRAVVTVDLGSLGGGVRTTVIEFSGTVSGLEALQLAGASPETITYGAMGQAVCKLFGAGDASVPGQCPGGWVYYRAVGGAGGWSQSGLGASTTVVHDGDVEGWRYGSGAPPFASFCAVAGCAPPPTTPTVAPTASGGGAVGASGGTTDSASPGGTTTGGPGGGPTDPATASTNPAGAGVGGSAPSVVAPAGSSTGVGRRVGRTVAAGPGPATTTPDGGSPLGVVVAAAAVAVMVGAGLLLRRRRRTA